MVTLPYNLGLITQHVGPQAKISSFEAQGRPPAIVFALES
jgi:hypothetical protein